MKKVMSMIVIGGMLFALALSGCGKECANGCGAPADSECMAEMCDSCCDYWCGLNGCYKNH